METWNADLRSMAEKNEAGYKTLQKTFENADKIDHKEFNATLITLLNSDKEHEQRIGLAILLSELEEKAEKTHSLATRIEAISKGAKEWQTASMGLATLHKVAPQKVDEGLRAAMEREDATLRQSVLQMANIWKSPLENELYLKGTKDEDAGVRLLAATYLSTDTLTNDGKRALVRLIADPDDSVSAAAIWSLGMVRKNPAVMAPCVTKLISGDIEKFPVSMVQAAVAYRNMWKESGFVGGRIAGMLPTEVWMKVIERTAAEVSSPEAIRARVALRLIALDVLADEKAPFYDTGDRIFGAVRMCLKDDSEAVRVKAISDIGRFGTRSIPVWQEILGNEAQWTQPEIVDGAIRKLVAALGDETTRNIVSRTDLTRQLRGMLQSKAKRDARYDKVRSAALESLVWLDEPVDLSALEVMAISDRSWLVRRTALLVMSRDYGARALPTLVRALDDRTPAVRAVAVGMLAIVTDKKKTSADRWEAILKAANPVTMRQELAGRGMEEALVDARTPDVANAFEKRILGAAREDKALAKDRDFQERLTLALNAAKDRVMAGRP